mgnify:FL=1
MSKIKTVFVAGATASGKTELAIKLAQRFDGEIVSADSMQIYKGIHIASAAPDTEEMQGIPHYMLEFLNPDDSFSVAEYVEKARAYIKDIARRGKLPIVAGGTGLYINSLADNISYIEEKNDGKLRRELEERFEDIGAEQMLKELKEIDPETAARLHSNDKKRIIRAFEVYRLTGKTVTEQNKLSKQGDALIDPCIIEITYRDREKLYDRINRRVDKMLQSGLAEEARAALQNTAGGAYQAIGHKELSGYISGDMSLEEAAEKLKMQTRRYAKRQLTWFRRDERINRIYADETEDVFSAAEKITENFLGTEEAE